MKLSKIVGFNPDSRRFDETQQLVDSHTFVGIEVEAENGNPDWFRDSPLSDLWQITEDGSLRDNGMEFRFSAPSRGGDIVRAIEEFIAFAGTTKMRATRRTGIHVHVDVRDFEWSQLRHFCTMYAIFEKPLFRWVGENRHKNIFCLPWSEADATIEGLCAIGGEPTSEKQVQVQLQRMHKYSALNMTSVMEHGTVEFRHMLTTFDGGRLLDWVNLLLSLKKYAFEFQGTTKDLCVALSAKGAMPFIMEVFGPRLTELLRYPEIVNDLFTGVRLAQELNSEWRRVPVYNLLSPDVAVPSSQDLTSRFMKRRAK